MDERGNFAMDERPLVSEIYEGDVYVDRKLKRGDRKRSSMDEGTIVVIELPDATPNQCSNVFW